MSGASSSSHKTSGRAHYKLTRSVTGTDGKTHTETVEMVDDDAVKFMRGLRLQRDNVPDLDQFGFRPLSDPTNFPQLDHHNRSHQHRPPSSSSRNQQRPSSSSSGNQQRPPSSSSASKHAVAAQDDNEFTREALQVHNELRRRHGTEPLRLNNELSKLAQQWADHLASTGTLVHSKTKYHNTNVGENLRCQSWAMTGKEMTDSWYSEISKYDFNNRQTYQPGTGHFTQVVWKGSQEVGFAQAKGTSMTFAVAMYYPPGNYMGEFAQNVSSPR